MKALDSPWPAEPYPGLRPFLEREAALLFGRQRQIGEVIERLRQTQFVAVLGGSGSGKSSLIHAGVTPALRSYGIHTAGDLWLPTVCTPGTNVSADDRAAKRHTPVVRLARRFAELLRSRGSVQADAERVEAIAAVFRQEGGFARLLDVFGHELALEPGLKSEDARVLFVLDQFEEVFHPTNADVDDARVLVERTLDHFFAPHPRCYVVLTMRSEHLNDCAGYLELPDAINKSSYLVRRLGADELREAILGPTEHFLRLMQLKRQRDEDSGVDVQALPPLPAQVRFEPEVITRLLKDVGAITHDPDHLPLLQHLLARLWQVAQARSAQPLLAASPELGMAEVVPGSITWADLHAAVKAERAPGGTLGEGNALRDAVDAWPSAAMRKFSEAEREAVDEVLRRLAFKDPKTGMYSQQRLRVHQEAPRILGPGKTADDLYALLHHRFLGSVNYLFWDQRDADNVTLKVSHEALIRGWGHFQRLVDAEFHHYEGFVALLRECAKWLDNDQAQGALLRRIELDRLHESQLNRRLALPELRTLWLRSLQRERDGERLASVAPALDDFLQRSALQCQRERQWTWVWRLSYGVVGVAAIAAYNLQLVRPHTEQLNQLFVASELANAAALTVEQDPPDLQHAHPTLQALLQAASTVEKAKEKVREPPHWLLGVDDQVRVIRNVIKGLEPAVNGRLRHLLTSTVFAVQRPAGAPLKAPDVRDNVACVSDRGESVEHGEVFLDQSTWSGTYRRALLRVVAAEGAQDIVLKAASAKQDFSDCRFGEQILRVPKHLNGHALVDSDLKFLIYSVRANTNPAYPETDASVTVYDLSWERDANQRHRLLPTRTSPRAPRTVITQRSRATQGDAETPPAFVTLVEQAAEQRPLAAVPTWRTAGGRTVQLGTQHWRLVSPEAQWLRLASSAGSALDEALEAPSAASAALPTTLPGAVNPSEPGCVAPPSQGQGAPFVQALASATRCLHITYVDGPPPPASAAGVGAGTDAARAPQARRVQAYSRQTTYVAVFEDWALDTPSERELERELEGEDWRTRASPVASFSPFGRVLVDAGQARWHLGKDGPCDGWLLSSEARPGSYLAAPWSTAALHALGVQLDVARTVKEAALVGCVSPH